ncbi:RAB3 GTPase activating protein subunit 1 [Oratosquilla oratoria]|uniref:RAB3 GTPase activating protein subunit 1 n=1 Tax=Oratosquilla oratoria TaxID=337810 RepID=UPI003F7674E5
MVTYFKLRRSTIRQQSEMADQNAEEQEVFEIVDFTTASKWECFIAAVEEILLEWQLGTERCLNQLKKGQLAAAKWTEKSTIVKFADFEFKMTLHTIVHEGIESPPEENNSSPDIDESEEERFPQALEDFMDMDNDFPARAHCLVRWYGLREFVTLAPAKFHQPITCPSKAKLLVSSLTIAATNTNCQVPLFVQVLQSPEKMFLGVGVGAGVRTDYDMVHLQHPPHQCTHLSGLLDVFRSKLHCNITSPMILVSVRFTYVLSEWPHTLWMQQPPDFDATLTEVGFSDLSKLPFGALSDPVSELQVSATWPCKVEDVLVDNDIYSDLDPQSAPLWSARLVTAPAPPCLLSEYLNDFLMVCRNTQTTMQILGPGFDPELPEGAPLTSALDRLTEPSVPSISSVVYKSRGNYGTSQEKNGPIPRDILVPILNILFPDAEGEDQTSPYPNVLSQIPEVKDKDGQTVDHPLKNVLNNMKSCAADGLVWRLAVVLCHVIHSLGGLPAAAHLWHEIILEMRFRWDNGFIIPGIGTGTPDLASTMFHQKLQMLNCCIMRRKKQESSLTKKSDEVEDDDEFYECEEEMEDECSKEIAASRSAWDKPEGRLRKCGNLCLLKTGEPLFIPVTQEPAPMTEDRLEEHAEVLLQLGSDATGSELRARMMSASLLSDMESFKAANPGAGLEDFVRWYSPRDWVEEEGVQSGKEPKGCLSTRMQIPGNMWQEVWSNSKPVPARRQKRLFDETREAEQVMHWLSSLGPGALCCHLLPTIFHAALCRITEEKLLHSLLAPESDSLPKPQHSNTLLAVLETIARRIARLSRQPPEPARYQEVVNQLGDIEVSIAKAQSLRHKFLGDLPSTCSNSLETLEELVKNLLESPDVTLEGGPRGPAAVIIRKLFRQAHRAAQLLDDSPQGDSLENNSGHSNKSSSGELGSAVGKEYILRALVPSPTPYSRPLPHRMFAVVLQNEFRLAGAFTEDTTFC